MRFLPKIDVKEQGSPEGRQNAAQAGRERTRGRRQSVEFARALRQGDALTCGHKLLRAIELPGDVRATSIARKTPETENKIPSGKQVTGGPNSRLVVALTAMATTSFDHLAQELFGRLAGLDYDREPVS